MTDDTVEMVDFGTPISDEDQMKDYIEFMTEALGAKSVSHLRTFQHNGSECQLISVVGNVGHIAMKRGRMRLGGWGIYWKQDFVDNFNCCVKNLI